MNNISQSVNKKRTLKLHNSEKHPVCQLKRRIQDYFEGYAIYDNLSEVVTVQQNFDDLLFPKDHSARSPADTYYMDESQVLRTHTSAHQNDLLKMGHDRFLVTGDVYRKDTIDRTHYPVFHQMEGVRVLPKETDALLDLIETLEGLVTYLFPGRPYRILDDYFPFTDPSIQMEVAYNGAWVEVLGAGVIHPRILRNCNIEATGWAFGLGIDRLLLTYCNIPDIRYLWSEDTRFIDQFTNGLVQFQSYSKYPSISKDISFWVNHYQENGEGQWDRHNDFCEMAREAGEDLIEEILLIDKFRRDDRVSLLYRMVYRSPDRTLLHEEINEVQKVLRAVLSEKLHLALR